MSENKNNTQIFSISKKDLSKISLNLDEIQVILDMTNLTIKDLIKRYPKNNSKRLKLSNPMIKNESYSYRKSC